MTFCKYCGRHLPESEGDICEVCMKEEQEEESPYPLLLAPPKKGKSSKSYIGFFISPSQGLRLIP